MGDSNILLFSVTDRATGLALVGGFALDIKGHSIRSLRFDIEFACSVGQRHNGFVNRSASFDFTGRGMIEILGKELSFSLSLASKSASRKMLPSIHHSKSLRYPRMLGRP